MLPLKKLIIPDILFERMGVRIFNFHVSTGQMGTRPAEYEFYASCCDKSFPPPFQESELSGIGVYSWQHPELHLSDVRAALSGAWGLPRRRGLCLLSVCSVWSTPVHIPPVFHLQRRKEGSTGRNIIFH